MFCFQQLCGTKARICEVALQQYASPHLSFLVSRIIVCSEALHLYFSGVVVAVMKCHV
jgi:hypothetical protein